jgi:hypothetical protein
VTPAADLVKKGHVSKQRVMEDLMVLNNERFPLLKLAHGVTAWKNGIKDSNTNIFYYFDDKADSPTRQKDEELYHKSVDWINVDGVGYPQRYYKDTEYTHLPHATAYDLRDNIPLFCSVFELQDFPWEAQKQVMALMCNALYPSNHPSCVQSLNGLMLMCVGKSGTGKSLLLLILQRFLAPIYICTINSNGAHCGVGPLAGIIDKTLLCMTEVDTDFHKVMKLHQFNALVSNEEIAISRKNKEDWVGDWYGHMVTATNTGMGFEGTGGFPRRVAMAQFRNKVEKKNIKLMDEIVAEELAYLEQCLHRCREEVANNIIASNQSMFNDIIHPFLQESAEEANRDADHVLAFVQMIEEDGGIQPMQNENHYCHLESLKKELWEVYLATLSEPQKQKARQDMDQKNSLISALESKGLVVDKKKTRKTWPPFSPPPTVQGRYVYGLSMYRPPNSNAADYDLLLQGPWGKDYVKPLNVTDQFIN